MARLQNPQIILHNPGSDCTLRASAMALGIKAITVEIGNPLVFQKRFIKHALLGVTQIMSYLKMIPVSELINLFTNE
jgi:predicted deacylase